MPNPPGDPRDPERAPALLATIMPQIAWPPSRLRDGFLEVAARPGGAAGLGSRRGAPATAWWTAGEPGPEDCDQKGWRPAMASASMSRLANSRVLPEARPRASRVMRTLEPPRRLAI